MHTSIDNDKAICLFMSRHRKKRKKIQMPKVEILLHHQKKILQFVNRVINIFHFGCCMCVAGISTVCGKCYCGDIYFVILFES